MQDNFFSMSLTASYCTRNSSQGLGSTHVLMAESGTQTVVKRPTVNTHYIDSGVHNSYEHAWLYQLQS